MLEKAKLVVQETQEVIAVMYNPTELTLGKTVHVQGDGANIQFQRVSDDDLTVSLFFDSTDTRTDIRKETNRILALTQPTTGTGVRKEPPIVVFTWAGALFTGVVTHLQQKFTMFLSSGVPIRAELTVTFKSVLTQKEDLAARGYFNCRKLWTVKQGDRLPVIAHKAMGDSALWRLIAAANGIYDAIAFPTTADIGRTLIIVDTHGSGAAAQGTRDV